MQRPSEEIILSVPAMACRHCVRAVSARLGDVPGVVAVIADQTARTIRVQGTAQPDALRSAVEDAGHEAAIVAVVP